MRESGCDNTKLLPHKGGLTIFTTSQDMLTPFAINVLDAVIHSLGEEEKKDVVLREEDSTSLLFPNDSPAWENVASTFTTGHLSQD